MGTTQRTQQSNQFDPGALSTYKGLQGPLGSMTTGYMQDPFGNPFFRAQQLMGNRQAMNLNQTGTSNLLRNMGTSNMFGGASSPAGLEMLQNQNRANTALTSNLGFLQPVQNALGMQQWAGNTAANYRPLQTGQNQVQSTGGLGTWLPQVAGMGLTALTGFPFGSAGSASGAGGGGMGAFGEGAGAWQGNVPGMGSAIPGVGGWAGLGSVQPSAPGMGMPGGMPGMGSQIGGTMPWAPAGPGGP